MPLAAALCVLALLAGVLLVTTGGEPTYTLELADATATPDDSQDPD